MDEERKKEGKTMFKSKFLKLSFERDAIRIFLPGEALPNSFLNCSWRDSR